jgi:hypothetical protein
LKSTAGRPEQERMRQGVRRRDDGAKHQGTADVAARECPPPGGMLGWLLYDHLRWSPGGTPEEVVRHLQRHVRLMRYYIVVFAGVVLCGMTRWVYWALCRALAPAKHEAYARQQRDAQALWDFRTRRGAEYDVDDDWEA